MLPVGCEPFAVQYLIPDVRNSFHVVTHDRVVAESMTGQTVGRCVRRSTRKDSMQRLGHLQSDYESQEEH